MQSSNQADDQTPASGYQRPATVIGFSPAAAAGSPENPNSPTTSIHAMDTSAATPKVNGVKFVFIPVSILIALERLQKFSNSQNIAYEVSKNNEAGKENNC